MPSSPSKPKSDMKQKQQIKRDETKAQDKWRRPDPVENEATKLAELKTQLFAATEQQEEINAEIRERQSAQNEALSISHAQSAQLDQQGATIGRLEVNQNTIMDMLQQMQEAQVEGLTGISSLEQGQDQIDQGQGSEVSCAHRRARFRNQTETSRAIPDARKQGQDILDVSGS